MSRALQDLDFVAIRVLNEKKSREHFVASLEFLDRGRIDTESRHACVLVFKVWNCYRDVSITIPMRVSRLATFVPRELNFEVVLFVANIDEREVREIQSVICREPERVIVEPKRALKVVDPDHRMNNFRQFTNPCRGVLCDAAAEPRRE